MKFPKKINVLGVDYGIEFKKEIEEDGEYLLGLTDFQNSTIYLRSGMSRQRIWQTLVHELVHVMLYEDGNDDYNSEDLVNPLGNVMYQVIKDNHLEVK